MALNKNFYNEIFEKETMWEGMLKDGLLNIYYIPQMKEFYLKNVDIILKELEDNKNEILNSIINSLNNIISKLDFLIKEENEGNIVNLYGIVDLFLINKMHNIVLFPNNKRNFNSKNIYDLRKKETIDDKVDYVDDDFYYDD